VGFNNIGSGNGTGGRSSDAPDDLSEMGRWAVRHAGWAVPVFGIQRWVTFIDTCSRRAEKTINGAVAAMSSIGRPDRFESSLRNCAIDLPLSIRFPDHHRYDSADIRRVESLLGQKGIDQLVVTEKDWVKLREIGPPSANVWVSRLELEIIGEDPLTLCEKPQAVPTAFL
jgi:tetraacyldisaccharide-1-P 4'-kinase